MELEWPSENFTSNDILHPRIGLEFSSSDEAIQFYKSYGHRLGFSVRKEHTDISKDGPSGIRVICSKAGYSKKQNMEQSGAGPSTNLRTPEKRRSFTRCGCQAYIRFRRLKSGAWQVSKFNNEHNHNLLGSPSKRRNLRSLKDMTEEEKQIINDMRAQNVGPSQIYNYLGVRAGGTSNLSYKKQDVSNVIADQLKALVGVDVETTLMFFRKKQEDDPDFFYEIEPDESGAIKNILWVDGRARRAYLEFGDVVTFDTTYNTNKYSMPVATFIGVNHHWHSIIFGCCLLRNEEATNFSWLFTTWLKAMYNKTPVSIITDQDPAMKKAIAEVFPTTVHRCCQWHVMRKARDHLGSLYHNKIGFKDALEAIVYRSKTVKDFENAWEEMKNKYELQEVHHLNVMYEKRTEWVPAYFRGTFFAFMTTTQRSECMNAVTKLWVNGHSSIYRFVLQFDKMIEGIWQRESDEDCKTLNETPILGPLSDIEVEAREVYTRNIFNKFKEIVKESTAGDVLDVERDTLYEVHISRHPQFAHWVPETHRVLVDKSTTTISCSCKGFEFGGLLCPHAIKVMHHLQMKTLPSKYILKRWCKGANEGAKRSTRDRSTDIRDSAELQAMRIATVQPKVNEFIKKVSKYSNSFKLFEIEFDKLMEKIVPTLNQESGKEVQENPAIAGSFQPILGSTLVPEYHDPPLSQCKGRKKKPQRFKHPVEANTNKKKKCSYCKETGHNRSSCHKRKEVANNNNGKEHYSEEAQWHLEESNVET